MRGDPGVRWKGWPPMGTAELDLAAREEARSLPF